MAKFRLPDFRRGIGSPRSAKTFAEGSPPRKHRAWVVPTLFVATLISTTFAGMQQSADYADKGIWLWILSGLRFSLPVLVILGLHEMGHYVTGKHYGMHLKGPYFIPAPNLFGTFGAVITMRGPVPTRRAILRVGVAGPWASFVLGALAYTWGLSHSQIVNVTGHSGIVLGDSLLTTWIGEWFFGTLAKGQDVLLHPTALAGWIGLFVTALNLLPMAQLDGGHVLYAATPRFYPFGSRLTWLFLLLGGIWGWKGWLVWAVMGLLIGVTHHPRPMTLERSLGWSDRLRIVAAIAVLILTFIPEPIRFLG